MPRDRGAAQRVRERVAADAKARLRAGANQNQIAAAADDLARRVPRDRRRAAAAGKRGPASKLQQQIERLSQLPKAKQKIVIEMLNGVLSQAGR